MNNKTHTKMEYNLAVENDEIIQFLVIWMELEGIY